MDYKNYIELMDKITKINKDINSLNNKQFDIKLSLEPKTTSLSKIKVKNNIIKDKMLELFTELEEVENDIVEKKQLREEMHNQLMEIENQAIDKWKFKVFILRWYGKNKNGKSNSYRDIAKAVHYSKSEIGSIIKEIEQEIKDRT